MDPFGHLCGHDSHLPVLFLGGTQVQGVVGNAVNTHSRSRSRSEYLQDLGGTQVQGVVGHAMMLHTRDPDPDVCVDCTIMM
jgi:hypothetical protein